MQRLGLVATMHMQVKAIWSTELIVRKLHCSCPYPCPCPFKYAMRHRTLQHDEDINQHCNFSRLCLTETELSVLHAVLAMMSTAYAEWMRILFSPNKGTRRDGLHMFQMSALQGRIRHRPTQTRWFKANRQVDIKVHNQKLFLLLFRWILKTSNKIWRENCRVYEFCVLWYRDLPVPLHYQMDNVLSTQGVITNKHNILIWKNNVDLGDAANFEMTILKEILKKWV